MRPEVVVVVGGFALVAVLLATIYRLPSVSFWHDDFVALEPCSQDDTLVFVHA